MINNINFNLPVLAAEEFEFFIALLVDYFVRQNNKGVLPMELCMMPIRLPDIAGYSIPYHDPDPNDPLFSQKVERELENLKERNILSGRKTKVLKRFERTLYRTGSEFQNFIAERSDQCPICKEIFLRLNEYFEKYL